MSYLNIVHYNLIVLIVHTGQTRRSNTLFVMNPMGDKDWTTQLVCAFTNSLLFVRAPGM